MDFVIEGMVNLRPGRLRLVVLILEVMARRVLTVCED